MPNLSASDLAGQRIGQIRQLALWIGPDGQEHSRSFAKQSDAQKYGTAMQADALRGIRYADPRRGAIAVREYGEGVFLPSMLHLRPNSADTYASHLRNHVYPALGARKIGTITRPTCSRSSRSSRPGSPRPRRKPSMRCCGP